MQTAQRVSLYVRMAAFPLGIGLTSVLVNGTLNRVMIVEQGLPTSFVGLCFALPLLIAPVRIWLGYQSDTRPLWGLRRTPYILAGTLLSMIGMLAATLLVLALDPSNMMLFGLLSIAVLVAFLAYGLGRQMGSNTFEALLADTFHGPQRPRAVTLFKVVMFVGIIGTAITLGVLLDPFSPARLTAITAGAVLLTLFLTVLAVVGQERVGDHTQKAIAEARALSFRATMTTVLWPDPHLRRFFLIVVLVVVGTMAQDILLEPYGGLVLGMTPGATTHLTALWGMGTVLAMLAAGLGLIQRVGYLPVLRSGLVLTMMVFSGLIVAGALGDILAFQAFVFVLGLGTGLSAAGLLTAVIEYTTTARAGILMGVWGMAQESGNALAGLFGGSVVDIVRLLSSNNTWLAYSTVFALEAGLLLVALLLVRRVPGQPVLSRPNEAVSDYAQV
ncbi:MAG: BCD family MFS transporter [Chloroflexaceae bacterium]|nr:BCD family MFS transporter [Chloroflexaceae bacterium]